MREWKVYKEEIKFSYQVLRSRRWQIGKYNCLLNVGIGHALESARPEIILCGGYNYLASWQALLWARLHSTPFLLWSESTLRDSRSGHPAVELLKTEFLRHCGGFVVPGHAALEYLLFRRLRKDRIYTAVNAVDNDLFASTAACARRNPAQRRTELGLPDRYFLFAGRLVREKGVFELLSAYAKLDGALRQEIALVFVGDGAARHALEAESSGVKPGTIKFAGFAQREQLASYYALAEMLILPTYTDTWGLVVNEAMACGLPVILSEAAGCGADLVTDNWNGRIVPPKDVKALASAMGALASKTEQLARMSVNSKSRILEYSPGEWCRGIVRMMEAAGGRCE
ncbi:MAG TPA: glycosyltransferase [Candidatus Sulfotelmatobacter sp.]|nr:glycosyltransferase [Candidatus Sulfotelmatobacter sp.]